MDNLAQEIGIAKGTLYLHFPSKEALVLAHIDRIVYRLLAKLQNDREWRWLGVGFDSERFDKTKLTESLTENQKTRGKTSSASETKTK